MGEFVSFKAAADAFADDLNKKYRAALPIAAAAALSRTAVKARDMAKEDMRHSFRNPTPYALNAPRAVMATKQRLASAVVLKTGRGGVPAGNFLGPEIDAGDRHVKASEKALRAAGVLPNGMFVEPSKKAPRDQYGNMLVSEIIEILKAMKAFKSGSRTAKSITRSTLAKHPKPAAKYFVAKSKVTRQPLGIYKVVGRGKVEPRMIFTRSPEYARRFNFYGLARKHAEAVFEPLLDAAIAEFGPK